MDPEYGLIHVRIQTWFAWQIQVYLDGHEWPARKLGARPACQGLTDSPTSMET